VATSEPAQAPPRELRARTGTAEATRAVGEALGRALRPLPPGGVVVALLGELGAGKTVFVQGVARGLGVPPEDRPSSPTFTILREHRAPGPPPLVLQHADAYRLSGVAELEAAGFEDACGEGLVTCVEWAGRVVEALPSDRLEVEIVAEAQEGSDDAGAEGLRALTLRALGSAAAAILARLGPVPGRAP
jgi:tRNA threonylcarbamoyladenosine biosynthesis protein TsaE